MVGSRFPASFHKLDMAKSDDGDVDVGSAGDVEVDSADSSSDSASEPGSAGSAASVPGSAPRFVPSPGEDIGMFVESLSFAYVRQRAIVYILRVGVFVLGSGFEIVVAFANNSVMSVFFCIVFYKPCYC